MNNIVITQSRHYESWLQSLTLLLEAWLSKLLSSQLCQILVNLQLYNYIMYRIYTYCYIMWGNALLAFQTCSQTWLSLIK